MSAAGREVGLSPAVVSKRISLLEDRLGARLFQRTTRHLTLTETGAGYFKRVVDILSLCEEAEDFVSRRNTKPRGRLKVTVPTAFSRLHVAPYIGAFLHRYPEIELDLHVSDAFVDIIREGFDLAIRIGELHDNSLVARRMAADTRLLCAAPAYLDCRGAPTSLAELDDHNCIAAEGVETWRLEGPGGETQVLPHGNVRSNCGEFIRELVVGGVGIGLLSTWDVGPLLLSGSLQVVLPHYRGVSEAAVHAVYPSREFMPAKVSVLIDFLTDLYGAQPYWERDVDLGKVCRPKLSGRSHVRRLAKAASAAEAAR